MCCYDFVFVAMLPNVLLWFCMLTLYIFQAAWGDPGLLRVHVAHSCRGPYENWRSESYYKGYQRTLVKGWCKLLILFSSPKIIHIYLEK